MSSSEIPFQDLRVRMGYVNPGNDNKYMYRLNWLIVISAALVVAFIWNIHSKDSLNDTEKKDMLTMGIIAAAILFLVVFPLNISRFFAARVSSHPIYFVYFLLSFALFGGMLGYYFVTGKDQEDQKHWLIASLFFLAIVGVVSLYLWLSTIYPYTWWALDLLSEKDYYSINPKLYSIYRQKISCRNLISKWLSGTGTVDNEEKLAKYLYPGNLNKKTLDKDDDKARAEGVVNSLNTELRGLKKKFYAFGEFKNDYDTVLRKSTIEGSIEEGKIKEYFGTYRNKSVTEEIGNMNTYKEALSLIQKNGLLNQAEYSEFLGFYDPILGRSMGGDVSTYKTQAEHKTEVAKLAGDKDKMERQSTYRITNTVCKILEVSYKDKIKNMDLKYPSTTNFADKLDKSQKFGILAKWEKVKKCFTNYANCAAALIKQNSMLTNETEAKENYDKILTNSDILIDNLFKQTKDKISGEGTKEKSLADFKTSIKDYLNKTETKDTFKSGLKDIDCTIPSI